MIQPISSRTRRYTPWIYWLTVVLVSVVGTLITDLLTDGLGVSLYVSPLAVPQPVLWTLAKQLRIEALGKTSAYSAGEQRWQHATEIRAFYGYVEFTEPLIAFRLTRWLYALCWTGTDRPSVLFERATTWGLRCNGTVNRVKRDDSSVSATVRFRPRLCKNANRCKRNLAGKR